MDQTEDRFADVKQLALRASAISMGFVFLSAAWRRFYNAPAKLDIDSAKDVANKLVAAAPGSPIESVVHFVLARPGLAEFATYAMTIGEALAGLGLIFGFLTRLSAVGAALLNIALMLIFGWQGFECLDEWTMAALGFAISVSVMLYGPGSFALDNLFGIDPLRGVFTKGVAIALTAASVIFTVGFYDYYFGIAQLERRTDVEAYRIVAEPAPLPDAAVLYVNAGASTNGAYVRSITFKLGNGETVTQSAEEIDVLKSYFEPWSRSGVLTDGVLRLRLGSKTEIRLPKGAKSATIDLIDNADQDVVFAEPAVQ
ncbi:TQO small subunit DoxD [Methyloceanibacter caenitepidi]|uniref:Terminal quinol oxidase, subunit n=1 Tax=Methyloceanibacter caenitepidi TaxID=1384459 RepID=A0A0A8K694_9HYPH|nr:TQO small subunit DoxD [Methyloceanibacter caenitepidi]BAQ18458.1 terminal quinol oxidase, subunit [Methyloceanibacter caenitepidi]